MSHMICCQQEGSPDQLSRSSKAASMDLYLPSSLKRWMVPSRLTVGTLLSILSRQCLPHLAEAHSYRKQHML